ncbi:hypothetical protein BST91_02895 [Nonlabens tegetincola]|uniref:YceI family protein n=1 Tax=Nonlabens tegetincola TaxID=323273 RepID=UPI000A209824|nr:YceI family protein [Nonlabens tegetincola]ARN70664.1 hypothetical protein BST91_02895 [Nonlabens tegetincola]
MKNLTLLITVTLFLLVNLQRERFLTRTGQVQFNASVPSFEPVEAINNNATIVLDVKSGELAALVLLRGFKFPIALMEEHFNENYVESDTYPKAVLKGTLAEFSSTALDDALLHEYTFNGTIELHGKKELLEFPVNLTQSGEQVKLTANFTLLPEQFNIEIPSIVSNKIADEINVSVNAVLEKR